MMRRLRIKKTAGRQKARTHLVRSTTKSTPRLSDAERNSASAHDTIVSIGFTVTNSIGTADYRRGEHDYMTLYIAALCSAVKAIFV